MTRLDRYLLARFGISWMVAMITFSVFYLLIHFFTQIDALGRARRGFDGLGLSLFEGVSRYYLTNLVFVMTIFLPFTVLLAAMWTGQQIARRGELLAIVAAGISLRRIALTFLAASLLIGLGGGLLREAVLPRLAPIRHELDRAMKGRSESTLDRLPMLADESGQVLHVGSFDRSEEVARGVRVMDRAGTGGLPLDVSIIAWRSGRWVPLEGAVVEGDLGRLERLTIVPRDLEMQDRGATFASIEDVRRQLQREPDRASLRMQLHAHWAYPFSCLLLPLLGLPLVLRPSRQTPWIAVGSGLLLSVAFFVLERLLVDLGTRDEFLHPALGAWLPVLAFGALGLLAFESMRT